MRNKLKNNETFTRLQVSNILKNLFKEIRDCENIIELNTSVISFNDLDIIENRCLSKFKDAVD